MHSSKESAWDPNGSFRQISPQRLELKKGGGCLSIFGIPFFAAGIFLLLAALQIIPMSNSAQQPWWTWLILLMMGIVFTGVGSSLVFGRQWIDIDISQRRIWLSWGLVVPMRGKSYALDSFRRLLIRVEKGDSDTQTSYTISLISETSGQEVKLYNSTEYGRCRAQAEMLMDFLKLKLEDRSTLTPILHGNSAEARAELQRSLATQIDPPQAPAEAICQVSFDGDTTRIEIPEIIPRLAWLTAFVPLMLFLLFGGRMLLFLLRSNTPWQVRLLFFGFGALFVVIPWVGFLKHMLKAHLPLLIVQISPRGILIRNRKGQELMLPKENIIGIDCGTREALLNQTSNDGNNMIIDKNGSYGFTIPGWMAKLSRFRRSDGVMIKCQSGIQTFGAGLEDAEVRYLYDLTRLGLGAAESLERR